ncbi:hypothetical protein SLU01_19480 [Sporosarcina luteola]|uniref:IraD/Gp25-like domain-containing protein n=1 Tax=Sporosarcina luteola TaxID=582850 RepID=A0A511Z857_9BACL|nr:GPW/gp25 family protein [Sporosarcina luteola]GEN83636.1 hypothetical protein SLU01_19480 [Sporosarcina luteola]
MLNLSNVQIAIADGSTDVDVKEVLDNVNVILTTPEGSVPFDRSFGMSVDLLDMPMDEAKSMYVVEAVTKVRKYEPRAVVDHVDFSGNEEGKLIPRVVLRIEAE